MQNTIITSSNVNNTQANNTAKLVLLSASAQQAYAAMQQANTVAATQQNSAKRTVNVNARANSSNNTTLVSIIFAYFAANTHVALEQQLLHVATSLFTQQYIAQHTVKQAIARAKQYYKLYAAQQQAQA